MNKEIHWICILLIFIPCCYKSRMESFFHYFFVLKPHKMVLFVCQVVPLGLASQSVHKWHVREESVFILGVAQLSKQFLHIFLWNLITKVSKDVFQLRKHHCSVAVFVIKLEELHIVCIGSRGVGSVSCSLYFLDNIIKLGKLLSLLISLAKTYTHLLGGVHAKSIHHISKEEQVDFTFAIPVIDVTDVFNFLGIDHLSCSYVPCDWVTALGELPC